MRVGAIGYNHQEVRVRALERILYVEDDPDIQAIAKMAMELMGGYQVEVCSSGRQAVEKVKALTPDFILLDVMMPDLDGPQTLQAIRKLEAVRNVPVAFMTARTQESEINNLLALGAIGVIAKPFDPMTLADQIRQLWENTVAHGK